MRSKPPLASLLALLVVAAAAAPATSPAEVYPVLQKRLREAEAEVARLRVVEAEAIVLRTENQRLRDALAEAAAAAAAAAAAKPAEKAVAAGPTATPPATKPATVEAATPADARVKLIREMQNAGLVGNIQINNRVGKVEVTATFLRAKFADKQKVAGVLFAWCLDQDAACQFLRLTSDTTGKQVGVFDKSGLKMD